MFVSLVYCHLVDFNSWFNISMLIKIKNPALVEFKCRENNVIYFKFFETKNQVLIVHPREGRLS